MVYLRKEYASVPFYIRLDSTDYYIVSNKEFNYYKDLYDGNRLFGLINGNGKRLLDLKYDKIYNPEVTILECFEFRKNGKIGLFNFKNNRLLESQFDYILPAKNNPSEIAIGIKENQAFIIDASTFQLTAIDTISLSKRLEEYSFDIKEVEDRLFYNVDYLLDGDKMGVFLLTSFIEKVNTNPVFNEYNYLFPDVGLPGTESWSAQTSSFHNMALNIVSFLVEFNYYGVDARDYFLSEHQGVVVNEKTHSINSKSFSDDAYHHEVCRYFRHRVVNDSIIETRVNRDPYKRKDALYNWEPEYNYYKVDKTGKFDQLFSDRHFSFTKFIEIDESYFEVCLSNHYESKEGNVEVFSHYSLEDLDVMRNEIFAEYGLIFKSEKWQQYFKQKSWFKGRLDNVNHLLSDIDKRNLEVILKRRKELEKNEEKFRQRSVSNFYAAG